ncbi:MAG: two-component system, OmpR family, sensor kinase [Microbacteriaceae bacterium]|nr:hypothetical protein [Microbacteriaceae bacterium]MDQ1553967.1 two-component system, OmpR family, sensor kinase [Microbacteriaceae bacterium]
MSRLRSVRVRILASILVVTALGMAIAGGVAFLVAYRRDAELAEVRVAAITYLVVAAIALVAISLVGWFVAGRLLRPIRVLRDAAARISETDLSERIPVVGRDDVSELTATVNDMLGRLDEAFTSQRLLLSDVGHELKTPITIVRGHLELLDPDRPDDVQATQELTLDELDRMSALVSDIALLAQTRHPDFVRPVAVDVSRLTESVFAKASALSNDHDWQLAQLAEVSATLDAPRITQAWLQLAENAVKFSPRGSAIVIGSTVPDPTHVDLWLRDQGRGIAEAQLERIFARFARAEPGRGVEGSGLGLSIVAAIAEAHGGRAFAESAPGTGSVFVIRLPRDGNMTGGG